MFSFFVVGNRINQFVNIIEFLLGILIVFNVIAFVEITVLLKIVCILYI